jgi:hypothetical protein
MGQLSKQLHKSLSTRRNMSSTVMLCWSGCQNTVAFTKPKEFIPTSIPDCQYSLSSAIQTQPTFSRTVLGTDWYQHLPTYTVSLQSFRTDFFFKEYYLCYPFATAGTDGYCVWTCFVQGYISVSKAVLRYILVSNCAVKSYCHGVQ